MELVRAGFGDDVNGGAARATQFRRIVAAVDLKFLDSVLAERKADTARIIVGLATINRDAVAPAVAAIKRKTALGSLFDAKILVTGKARGIGHARHEQSKGKIIAAVNGKFSDVLFV